MLLFLGYLGAIVMGMTLGLIGAGGSILTIPILVYFMNVTPVMATSYSLFLVGLTALVASIQYFRQGNINFPIAIGFGLPSILTVYITRR